MNAIEDFPAAIDEFTSGLLAYLNDLREQGFNIGVEQLVAVEDLVLVLVARNELVGRLDRLGNYIGPLVCSTPQQQSDFQYNFAIWMQRFSGIVRADANATLAREAETEEKKAARWKRWVMVGILTAIPFTIVSMYWFVERRWPNFVTNSFIPTTLRWTILVTLSSVLVLGTAWLASVIRSTLRFGQFLKRRKTKDAAEIISILTKGVDKDDFNERGMIRVAQRFRMHRRVGWTEVDTDKTIDATLRAGGWFTPIQRGRLVTPEYLALVERTTAQDHHAKLADAFLDSLVEHGVSVTRYYFESDPRVCLPQRPANAVSLFDLTARHPDHRLVIFADPQLLCSRVSGGIFAWVRHFGEWRQRALFTLHTPGNQLDRQLRATGCELYQLTEDGLNAYTRRFSDSPLSGSPRRQVDVSYPSSLRNDPTRYLVDHEPPGDEAKELMRSLREYLGERGYDWFCACAVYPELHWHLTITLGGHLTGRRLQFGRDRELAALVRTPWFRHGRIPNWLRRKLIHSLGDRENHIRAVIRKIFVSSTSRTGTSGSLQIAYDRRFLSSIGKRFVQSIIRSSDRYSQLREHVFVTFMNNPLAVRIPRAVSNSLKKARLVTSLMVPRRTIRRNTTRQAKPEASQDGSKHIYAPSNSLAAGLNRALRGPNTYVGILDLDANRKFIVFSDQHKGAGDAADEFRLCKSAYKAALKHYRENDYTLILLGDVEDLWGQGFQAVRKEYDAILRLEGSFPPDRYFRVWGEHDDYWMSDKNVRKHLGPYMPTDAVYEALRFEIEKAGQRLGRIFFVHGHQGSLASDKVRGIARLFVRFYRILQRIVNIGKLTPARDVCLRGTHDRSMYEWASAQEKLVMVAGHTHRPVWGSRTHLQKLQDEWAELERHPPSPERDRLIEKKQKEVEDRRRKSGDCNDVRMPKPIYFNTGCCMFDDGTITGIEIEADSLRLVKWTPDDPNDGKASVRVILEMTQLESIVKNL